MEAEQQSLKEVFRNALLALCVQRSGSSAHAEAEVAALFRDHFRDKNGEATLSPQAFNSVIQGTPLLHNEFNGAKIGSLFAALDVNKNGHITATQLNELLCSDASRARTTAIRLKKSLSQKLQSDEQIEELFEEAAHGANYVNLAQFRHIVTAGLDAEVAENELAELYQVFDVDGDGKLTLSDFEHAISRQAFDVTERVLSPVNPRAIVDIQVSTSTRQEEELQARGYTMLKPNTEEYDSPGSFGHSIGVWIRRKEDGDAGARLAPIVDILLEPQRASTSLVLGRYLCNIRAIKGQYIWFRRAQTQAEAETAAIVDLKITMGKMKDATNAIWASPGVGWIRVDGNFNKGYLGGPDAFFWLLPVKPRQDSSKMVSPLKAVGSMPPETRLAELVEAARMALRKFIPVEELRKSSPSAFARSNSVSDQTANSPSYDFCSLFSQHDTDQNLTVNLTEFGQMLVRAGACVDKADVRAIFHQFDWHQQGAVAQNNFTTMLALTPAEVDSMLQEAKARLRGDDKSRPDAQGKQARGARAQLLRGSAAVDGRNNEGGINGFKTSLMRNRVLMNVFRQVDLDGDGLLSAEELGHMLRRLEFFVTSAEVHQVQQILDRDASGRIEEGDFIAFMNTPNIVTKRSANRIRSAAIAFRNWALQLRSADRAASAVDGIDSESPWQQLKRFHEANGGGKFPDYIAPTDLSLVLNRLGVRLHVTEAMHLSFVMAPKKHGRVHQKDWHWFLLSSCRTFGELQAMFERTLLPALVAAGRSVLAKRADEHTIETFEEQLTALLTMIRKAGDSPVSAPRQHDAHKRQCFVPLVQLRSGIADFGNFDPQQGPNLEEYAHLALYGDAVELVDGQYAVDADRFIRALIEDIVHPQAANVPTAAEDGVQENAVEQLRTMIRTEARHHSRRGKYDYTIPFALFDEDGNGVVPLSEFQATLDRLMPKAFTPEDVQHVIELIDTSRKGFITLDDFIAFAETGGNGSQNGHFDDLASTDTEQEANLQRSRQPPTSVTRNNACDNFMWELWKACSAADAENPQAILFELAQICRDKEGREQAAGLTPVKSLWSAVLELDIKLGLTKKQFKEGVAFLTNESGMVDYDTLILGASQMGKAEMAREEQLDALDDATFESILEKLQRSARTAEKEGEWESALRRADSNSDGSVTMEEFRKAAKARSVRLGTNATRFVRRLFKSVDRHSHGVVAISRLMEVISGRNDDTDDVKPSPSDSFSSDVDSLDEIFAASDSLTREGLFAKLRTLTQPSVSLPRAASKVERYFRKHDKSNSKLASEEQFREFLDRAKLSKQMSKGEIDQLCRILRQSSGRGGKRINYVEFCDGVFGSLREMSPSADDIRRREVLHAFRKAAVNSADQGRHFTALASLFDPNDSGCISLDDLQQTSKMMNFPINKSEANLLVGALGPSVDTRNIPYRELEDVVLYSRDSPGPELHRTYETGPRTFRASRTFASSRAPQPPLASIDLIRTSSGHTILPRPLSAPARARSSDFGDLFVQSHALNDLYGKIRQALRRSSFAGTDRRSLAQRLAAHDPQRAGFMSLRSLIEELEQLDVPVMPHDLGDIRRVFGRPPGDSVDYRAFVDAAETAEVWGEHDVLGADSSDSVLRNPRFVERVCALLSEQTDIMAFFDQACRDRSGLLSAQEFAQVARSLQLPLSMASVNTLLRHYASVVEPAKICYEDVVKDMIGAASTTTNTARTRAASPNPDFLRTSSSAVDIRPPVPATTPVFRSSELDSTFASLQEFRGQPQEDLWASQASGWRPDRQQPQLNISTSFSSRPPTAKMSPSSPPRKVGAMMWGKDTELTEKGRAPGILGRNEGTWLCKVCYHVGNSLSSANCEMCSSPNPESQGFQLTEECPNCLFPNGEFAKVCEMCGTRLHLSAADGKQRF